jgi:4-amino-4-deoxy-L-arabinose transferase-like glycosyltransferase
MPQWWHLRTRKSARAAVLSDTILKADRSMHSRVAGLLLAGVLAVSAVLNFVNLGSSSLFSDEAIYAVPAHNAVAHGQWYPLIYQETAYTWKPPFAVWPVATSFLIFGESAFADRLPSAFFAVLVAGLVFICATSMLGAWYGFFAAIVFAACPLWIGWHGARQGVADPLLCLLLLGTLAAYQRHRETGARAWLAIACGAVALSGLCKGLTGPAFIFVATACNECLVAFSKPRATREPWRHALLQALRMPAVLFVSGVSLYAIWLADNVVRNPGFVAQLYRDVISRALHGVDPGHVQGAGFYLRSLVQACGYPGLALMLLGALVALRSAQNERLRLTAVWAIAVTVLIHCSVSKLPWYIDSALPAMAILAAAGLRTIIGKMPRGWLFAMASIVVPVTVAGSEALRAWHTVGYAAPRKIHMEVLADAVRSTPQARFYSENFDRPPTADFSGWNMYFREWNEYYLDRLEDVTLPVPDRLQASGCDVVLTDRAPQLLVRPGFERARVVPLKRFDPREAELAVMDLCQGRIAAQLAGS